VADFISPGNFMSLRKYRKPSGGDCGESIGEPTYLPASKSH